MVGESHSEEHCPKSSTLILKQSLITERKTELPLYKEQ